MGTTSQKLTYLNDTKGLLKQKINNLGGDITDNTTFRQYANQLQTIYDNAPKTSYAEGSNITLSNTLKGKLDFEDGIVGIGDTEQYTTNGYQLIKQASFGTFTDSGITFTQLADGGIKLNGTATANTDVNILTGTKSVASNSNNITLQANQEYTMSCNGTTSSIRLSIHTSSYTNLHTVTGNVIKFTETSDVVITAVRIIVLSGEVINNLIVYPMLEKGSTAHDWEPYTNGASPNPSYPQEIEVVRGKNRANYSGTYTSSSLSNYGAFNLNLDNTISIETNKTYYFSADIRLKSGTGTTKMNVIRSSNNTGQTTSAITNPNMTSSFQRYVFQCTYSQVQTLSQIAFQILTTDTATLEVKNIMIAEENTSYLPYNTIEVVERGINLFNIGTGSGTKPGGTTITYNNSRIKVNGTTTQGTNIVEPNVKSIGIFKRGTYVFSTNILSGSLTLNGAAAAIYIRNSSVQSSDTLNVSGGFNVNLSNKTFTLTQDTELFLQIYANASGIVFNNYEVGIQIEEGSSSTSFEEYITPITYQLSLGEYEFAKIGNYVDTIEYDVENDKVYKNEVIGKYTFTGNETIEYHSGNNRFVINDIVNNLDVQARQQIYSNRYKFIESGSADYAMFTYWNTVVHQVFIYHKDYTSPSDLLTYFANNNTYFYYIRNNLNKIEITGTLKDQIKALYNSHSFTGTTIIEIDGQLPLIIKVRALKGN